MEVDDTIEATTYSVVGGGGISTAAVVGGRKAEASMTRS